MFFLFFSKFCAPKSGVRLIYGCGLYTDVYGTLNIIPVRAFQYDLQNEHIILGYLRDTNAAAHSVDSDII